MITLLVHGWGFGPAVWDRLAPLLPGTVLAWDLGYFGPPATPDLPDAPVLAIGHSNGAAWLLRRQAEGRAGRWAGFVAINGIRRAPAGARVLDRMQAGLATDPAAAVAAFRRRCGAPPAEAAPDPDRLSAALEAMRATAPLPDGPSLVLSGASDPLLPAGGGDFPGGGPTHPGGHLLPLQAPAWCADRIVAFATPLG